MAAEYMLAAGNRDVILCERGIRTFERATRNTLDLSAIPVLKELTHLPVIVDPSTGRASVASSRRWHSPRSPPAPTGCSSRSTRIRRAPSRTERSRSPRRPRGAHAAGRGRRPAVGREV